MLLAIGLTQVPLAAATVVVGWLFAFAWRGAAAFQQRGRFTYNALQIVLVLLTAGALGVLLSAVGEGLLGRPEMFVVGNDSTASKLRWFQALSDGALPQPGCLTVSVWWYRLLMLAWALWLAAALLRWLRRAWQEYGQGGLWRGPKKPPILPPRVVPAG